MVDISASMVKDLREKSGAAMMDCKKALVEAAGDFERAFEWLRQKGAATASQKSSRTASEGLVVGQVSSDGKSGALVEVNCETDFVARNEQFIELTKQICETALTAKAKTNTELLAQKVGTTTLQATLTEAVAKTGENIVIRRFATCGLAGKNGIIGLYIHALGGKMGALVEIESDKPIDPEKFGPTARELAMHVVSAKPQYLTRNDIASDVIENERRIEAGKADLADKKPEIREKIVTGRVDKMFAERCLVEQPFVKDQTLSVGKYLEQKGKELDLKLTVTQFVLFILGEGVDSPY